MNFQQVDRKIILGLDQQEFLDCKSVKSSIEKRASEIANTALFVNFVTLLYFAPFFSTGRSIHIFSEEQEEKFGKYTLFFLMYLFVGAAHYILPKIVCKNTLLHSVRKDTEGLKGSDPFPAKKLSRYLDHLPEKLLKKMNFKQIKSVIHHKPLRLEILTHSGSLNDTQQKIWDCIKELTTTSSVQEFIEKFQNHSLYQCIQDNPSIVEYILRSIPLEYLDNPDCQFLFNKIFQGTAVTCEKDKLLTLDDYISFLYEIANGGRIDHVTQKIIHWAPFDIGFIIQGEKVKANCSRLNESSRYFRDRFSKMGVVNLNINFDHLPLKPFRELINFCMYGIFYPTEETFNDLYALAKIFQVDELISKCSSLENPL